MLTEFRPNPDGLGPNEKPSVIRIYTPGRGEATYPVDKIQPTPVRKGSYVELYTTTVNERGDPVHIYAGWLRVAQRGMVPIMGVTNDSHTVKGGVVITELPEEESGAPVAFDASTQASIDAYRTGVDREFQERPGFGIKQFRHFDVDLPTPAFLDVPMEIQDFDRTVKQLATHAEFTAGRALSNEELAIWTAVQLPSARPYVYDRDRSRRRTTGGEIWSWPNMPIPKGWSTQAYAGGDCDDTSWEAVKTLQAIAARPDLSRDATVARVQLGARKVRPALATATVRTAAYSSGTASRCRTYNRWVEEMRRTASDGGGEEVGHLFGIACTSDGQFPMEGTGRVWPFGGAPNHVDSTVGEVAPEIADVGVMTMRPDITNHAFYQRVHQMMFAGGEEHRFMEGDTPGADVVKVFTGKTRPTEATRATYARPVPGIAQIMASKPPAPPIVPGDDVRYPPRSPKSTVIDVRDNTRGRAAIKTGVPKLRAAGLRVTEIPHRLSDVGMVTLLIEK